MSLTVEPVTHDFVPSIEQYSIEPEASSAFGRLTAAAVADMPEQLRETDLVRLAELAYDMPAEIRRQLVRFRYSGTGGMVLSGLPVDVDAIGPTPTDMAARNLPLEVRRVDLMLILLASLLGDPVSYAEVQGGRLILDILPVKGDENTQLGSSSRGSLEWHTEDAWNDFRADWFMLFCLRNPQQAATTFARVDDAIPPGTAPDVLFRESFRLKPDSSHAPPGKESLPKQISLLSGDRSAPFVRMDPAFMEDVDEDSDRARDDLKAAFDKVLQDVVLEPGDIFVVDNRRAVHGRKPFQARFDGTDRWLRLVNVTADLRRSEGHRGGSHGRALVD
jgi:hypothetical protein